ncbi:MAG TPA: hypothetical protein PLE59_01020 [Bacteroidales bacterium]|nr:hypothetical protein [Bacteroidales bacterium]HPM15059.1 hypothetical protein [Bacilli bacterium]HQL11796.1 hypothetical protein [bacterium]
MLNIVPTNNLIVVIVIGASTGLSAVGINQTIKQLGKSDKNE